MTSTGSGKIVINEVELNPTGYDDGNEWVELYNSDDNYIDISEWVLQSTCGGRITDIQIPTIPLIPPRGFCVVVGCGQWLDNDEELVILLNASGIEVDRTPYLDDTQDTDCSWSRYPDGYDTDSNYEWGFMKSSKGGPASGDVCHPNGTRVYFHISGIVEGNIEPIEVTTTGYKITPHSSYFADIRVNESNIRGRTAALDGHYNSEEIIYNGERSVVNAEPRMEKPEYEEREFGIYGVKNINYTGESICDREYVGDELGDTRYYSGANFLYNTKLSKERIGTSLKAHSEGIADLKYKQTDSDGNVSREYFDRYVGEFDIERHIETKFEDDIYRSYYGPSEYPNAIYIDGKLIYVGYCDAVYYSNETTESDLDWLTCCFGVNDYSLVGSKNSNVYHYAWCAYARMVPPENRICFSSPEDAKSKGYRPCEICCPKDSWSGRYDPCMNSTNPFHICPG